MHAVANPLINITAPGPPRHLSEAARHDSDQGADGGRHQRRLRPRLRDGSLVRAWGLTTCWKWRIWACMSGGHRHGGNRRCFEAVTVNGAKALNLEGYGIAPGAHADLIVLQAADPIEALRLRPARLQVIRQAPSSPKPGDQSRLSLGNQSLQRGLLHIPQTVQDGNTFYFFFFFFFFLFLFLRERERVCVCFVVVLLWGHAPTAVRVQENRRDSGDAQAESRVRSRNSAPPGMKSPSGRQIGPARTRRG